MFHPTFLMSSFVMGEIFVNNDALHTFAPANFLAQGNLSDIAKIQLNKKEGQ
jgi:hypothetical protein